LQNRPAIGDPPQTPLPLTADLLRPPKPFPIENPGYATCTESL